MFDFLLSEDERVTARGGAGPGVMGPARHDPGHGPGMRFGFPRSSWLGGADDETSWGAATRRIGAAGAWTGVSTCMVMEEVGTLGYIFASCLRRGRGARVRRHRAPRNGCPEGGLCEAAPSGREVCGRVPDRTPGGIGLLRHHHPGRGPGGPLRAQRAEAVHRVWPRERTFSLV